MLVLTIETAVLHLWLHARHPVVAWTLTILSLAPLAWLAIDYRSMGRETVRVPDGALTLRIGLRARAEISLDAVVHATRPTWQELPAAGSPEAKGYRTLTKPASPNVLLLLDRPNAVVLAGAIRVPTCRIGLHLDDPDGFLAALHEARGIARVAVTSRALQRTNASC